MEESLMQSLTNFGGLGIALAMLFYLHTTGLKAVRQELQLERDRCDKHLLEERQLWKETISEVVQRVERIEKR
jgi:hypothetical protein